MKLKIHRCSWSVALRLPPVKSPHLPVWEPLPYPKLSFHFYTNHCFISPIVTLFEHQSRQVADLLHSWTWADICGTNTCTHSNSRVTVQKKWYIHCLSDAISGRPYILWDGEEDSILLWVFPTSSMRFGAVQSVKPCTIFTNLCSALFLCGLSLTRLVPHSLLESLALVVPHAARQTTVGWAVRSCSRRLQSASPRTDAYSFVSVCCRPALIPVLSGTSHVSHLTVTLSSVLSLRKAVLYLTAFQTEHIYIFYFSQFSISPVNSFQLYVGPVGQYLKTDSTEIEKDSCTSVSTWTGSLLH